MSALRFPEDFPPTSKWDEFFFGVRWLGPDLSFFRDLKARQGERSVRDLASWGGGLRQDVASAISRALAGELGWPSEVFLPEDSAVVAFHGPRFDFNDPESAFDEIVEILRRDFQISAPEAFWAEKSDATFGELVDGLLNFRGA